MTTRLLTLIIKEFKAIWKDPRSRMIVTIMPIIQLIVFANAVTMEVKNIDMLVLDNSRSYYSRELISHFANSPWFNSVAVVYTPEQLNKALYPKSKPGSGNTSWFCRIYKKSRPAPACS